MKKLTLISILAISLTSCLNTQAKAGDNQPKIAVGDSAPNKTIINRIAVADSGVPNPPRK